MGSCGQNGCAAAVEGDAIVEIVSVDISGPDVRVTVAGEKLQEVFDGRPEQLRVTVAGSVVVDSGLTLIV